MDSSTTTDTDLPHPLNAKGEGYSVGNSVRRPRTRPRHHVRVVTLPRGRCPKHLVLPDGQVVEPDGTYDLQFHDDEIAVVRAMVTSPEEEQRIAQAHEHFRTQLAKTAMREALRSIMRQSRWEQAPLPEIREAMRRGEAAPDSDEGRALAHAMRTCACSPEGSYHELFAADYGHVRATLASVEVLGPAEPVVTPAMRMQQQIADASRAGLGADIAAALAKIEEKSRAERDQLAQVLQAALARLESNGKTASSKEQR